METKHWVYLFIVVLLALGLLWLAKLLPGFGLGLGGGKGGGAGQGGEKSLADKPPAALVFPAGTKGVVVIGKDGAELRVGSAKGQPVTLEQIEKWAAEGREIEVRRKKDVSDETVQRLKKLETESHGKIYVCKEFVD